MGDDRAELPDQGDVFLRALADWAAEERVARAATSRSLERSLRQQAAASATWAGLLVDLAESQTQIVLTVGSRHLAGVVRAVAAEFCVVSPRVGKPAIVRSDRITAVATEGRSLGERSSGGSRRPVVALSLAAALARLSEERAPVRLGCCGDYRVAGELVSVGEDMLTLQTDPPKRNAVHLRIAQVEVCELR